MSLGARGFGVLFVVAISAAVFSSAAEPDPSVLFTRADAVEMVVGQVELRRAYTKRIALPQEECPGEPMSCTEDRIYGQIYSLEFIEERLHGGEDGEASTERIDRGRLFLALELSPEHEDLVEEALIGHLEGLGVAAFGRPLAGMGYLRDPFSQTVLVRSALPAWVCSELAGEYRFDLVVAEDGGMRRVRSGSGDLAERPCREIERAVDGVESETLRSMPSVRAQRRHAVRLQSSWKPEGLTWADDLAELPADASLVKQHLDGKRTGAARDYRNGVYRGHEGRYNDVERDVLLPQASLHLLEAPMWVSRWTFETVNETFGLQPELIDEMPVSIVMAVIPVADPSMDELTRTRTALFVPDKELVAAAMAKMEESETLEPSLVPSAFATAELWPAQGDWMVVSCLDDGTSRYGIAPFAAAAKVTNAQEACGAIVREIGPRE